MKYRLLAILLMAFNINALADSVDATTLTTNRADGTKIDYYLIDQKEDSKSDTLLLILQGSDCNSALNIKSIFTDYKNIWPQSDLLLIEKYGIDKSLVYSADAERKDCPTAYLKKDNPKQRVEDIAAVLSTINKERNYDNLVVIGGSEGAVIANLLAASNHDVDATISFNGGGQWFIDDVLHSISSEQTDVDKTKESVEGFKGFAQHILNREPFDIEVSGHGYYWWRQMLSIDQLRTLKSVNTPLLIVQRRIDKSVSPQKVTDMMSELQKSGKENIEFRFYENLDHRFNNSAGQEQLANVITDMNSWLKKTLNADQTHE